MLLIAGTASDASDDKTTRVPVTYGNSPNHTPPPPFGNVPGRVMNDSMYTSVAPCYMEKMIRTYGPVPVFTKDHGIVSRGILSGYSIEERDALYVKLDNVYESMIPSFKNKYTYPDGPVISYGYDALGLVEVGIYEKSSVDQKTIGEVYAVIAGEADRQGIKDVPVVFYSESMPQLDLGRADVWRPVIVGVQTGTPVGH